MARSVTIAAIQMDANPAPTLERLARAQRLVEDAVRAGAQLVVLPELFNVGYTYADSNFDRAEAIDGLSATWLRTTAATLKIHLAGTLMIHEGREIRNALLLFAPNGRMWRYDKRYPWAWERGYFRAGRRNPIAKTELGRIGMLICWDSAHRNLWRAFAGKVDLVLISSCPPDASNPTYHFPNGEKVTFDDLGPIMGGLKETGERLFGDMINQQTAWLGVPSVNSVGAGTIKTAIPNGLTTLLAFLPFAPMFARHLHHAQQIEMSCGMVSGCKVVADSGVPLAEVPAGSGDAYAIATVELPASRRRPATRQPDAPIPWLSYFSSDVVLRWLSVPIYKKGLKALKALRH